MIQPVKLSLIMVHLVWHWISIKVALDNFDCVGGSCLGITVLSPGAWNLLKSFYVPVANQACSLQNRYIWVFKFNYRAWLLSCVKFLVNLANLLELVKDILELSFVLSTLAGITCDFLVSKADISVLAMSQWFFSPGAWHQVQCWWQIFSVPGGSVARGGEESGTWSRGQPHELCGLSVSTLSGLVFPYF